MVANQSGSSFSSSTLAVLFAGNPSLAKAKHNPSESQEVGKGKARWRNQGRMRAVAGSGCKTRIGAENRNRKKTLIHRSQPNSVAKQMPCYSLRWWVVDVLIYNLLQSLMNSRVIFIYTKITTERPPVLCSFQSNYSHIFPFNYVVSELERSLGGQPNPSPCSK